MRKKIRKWIADATDAAMRVGRRVTPPSLRKPLSRLLLGALVAGPRVPACRAGLAEAIAVWTRDASMAWVVSHSVNRDCHAPMVSIVVLTHNNRELTQLCVESIYRHAETGSNFEVIIVDNQSTDETRAYLGALAEILPNLQVLPNNRNLGFASGNNTGIVRSRGDYIVLLNNDTIVTPCWLPRLIAHLERSPGVGIVGPVTNSAGNEQMVRAHYGSIAELDLFAEKRSREHAGRSFGTEMLGMFCVVMRRRLVDEIGLLDERFGIGTFEDDDYCHRAVEAGHSLLFAGDVFIHHFGGGTMRSLSDREYGRLFEHNRKLYEGKWGVRWRPRKSRRRG